MVEQLATTSATKISFGVRRREESRLQVAAQTAVNVENDSEEEREREEEEQRAKRRRVTHFDDGTTIGDEDAKKEAITIPMVVADDWRTQKLLEKLKNGTITDEERAKLELMRPSGPSEEAADGDTRDKIVVDSISTIETEDADYSAVPIESFGLAILRGCDWKDGDGIGKIPQKVALRLPNRRPPGLGLGATPKQDSNGKKNTTGGKEETIEEIKTGSFIKIVDGRHNGLYGKVEGRDDDSNSYFVKAAIGGKKIKVSQFVVVAVTAKEYERDSKCLNKKEYDEEKKRIDEHNQKHMSDSKTERSSDSKSHSSSRNDEREREEEEEVLWVRSELLVRFVNSRYERGKLYMQKVRVVDVAGRRNVTVADDRGITYYNVKQRWLETVIPRNIGEKLMIVGGNMRGKLAIMVDKDKKHMEVVAKLVASNESVKVSFDDVCAVQISHEEDYE